MKLFIFYALLFISFGAKAQEFVIVTDPDGYVNVRKDSNVKSPILWKAYNGDLLVNYDTDRKIKNWINVATAFDIRDSLGKHIDLKTKNLQGFVYINRTVLLSKLPHVKGRQLARNRLTIKNDSITFTLTTKVFKSINHTIHKKDGYVDKIDSRHPFGIDGELPHLEIKTIDLIINSRRIKIPSTAFNDLYEPALSTWNIYFDNKGTIYISSQNSDGAGGYALIWVITDGKLIKRYVDNSYA